MKKWMAARLLFVLLAGGCIKPGDEVVVKSGKDYKPASTDVLNRHGKIENLEQFEMFVENVQNGKKDNVRIVSYTVEGDPILQDLEFDGETIQSVEDSRMDAYGNGEVTKMSCEEIEYATEQDLAANVYNLKQCNKKQYNETVLWYD
ncbi:DUF4362 domain-containing protein [Bacillus haikouensis]|uniref:DUF4362 domain-containing protein n=1 Tax=Bacillus haikouensis TaxID=1510468 RepID=UPI001FE2B8BA|nr:DUF4362 domain-containing protein [Bacillus haikouensis]